MKQENNQSEKNLFHFLKTNPRGSKPRKTGITEIRGPYYTVMGKRYLQDILETMGQYVDSLKFAGGSFALIHPTGLRDIIETAHAHDILEISCGFITLPTDDWLRIIEMVQKAGLKAKPEVGIQFGAGGATATAELKAEGTRDPGYAIKQAKRFLEAGVYMIMIESEGVTENTDSWRTDVVARFMDELNAEKIMFEAADPAVFEWYIKNYGCNVNLFIDHSQIVQLECLRSGIWGTKSTWGRIQSFK